MREQEFLYLAAWICGAMFNIKKAALVSDVYPAFLHGTETPFNPYTLNQLIAIEWVKTLQVYYSW